MPNPTNVPMAQTRSKKGAILANSRITNATSKVLFNFVMILIYPAVTGGMVVNQIPVQPFCYKKK